MGECVKGITLDEAIENARKVANSCHQPLMAFETMNSIVKDNYREKNEQLAQWLEELKEYKELEEQGRLLKLPCKSGEKVYIPRCIEECKYDFECPFDDIRERSKCTNDEPCENAYKVYKIVESAFELKMLKNIGTKIFLSREEAEAKLKEMRCNND